MPYVLWINVTSVSLYGYEIRQWGKLIKMIVLNISLRIHCQKITIYYFLNYVNHISVLIKINYYFKLCSSFIMIIVLFSCLEGYQHINITTINVALNLNYIHPMISKAYLTIMALYIFCWMFLLLWKPIRLTTRYCYLTHKLETPKENAM